MLCPGKGRLRMAKEIRITVDGDRHEELKDMKNGRTWLQVLEDGAEAGKYE